MIQGLIGRKLGMTQIFDDAGVVHPVTVIECGPNVVTQVKTTESDGYEAVQLGFGIDKRLNKAEQGHRKESGYMSRKLREVKADDVAEFEVGQVLKVDAFSNGELVDVTGTSKGKGFQGVMRRHNFSGGAGSHGSMFHRAPGSIGASSDPSRVFPGMRGPGHMGDARISVKNLRVVRVDVERNLLLVRGAVPGPPGATVLIRKPHFSATAASRA